MIDTGENHTVAVLTLDGMSAFEFGSVAEVFGLPRPEIDGPWYELRVCSPTPGVPLRIVGGFAITAPHGLDAFAAADTLVVPTVPEPAHGPPPEVAAAIRTAHERGARVVSICSGAFALAAAGLLDGREATTHWRHAGLLARRFPEVRVNPGVLFVDHGDVLTGAGSAAGLDLCLHLVRRDHGATIANTVARRLVIAPHRDGGQAQFIESSVPAGEAADGIAASMAHALGDLTAAHTVDRLARVAHMAPRTFIRNFAKRTGTSPMRWLTAQRIAASLPLLEAGDLAIPRVGAAVGFDSPATFRHHFTRAMRTSPSAYRRSFSLRSPRSG